MAVYYYTGGVGGAWSTSGAWTLAGSAGTTGNPGVSDIAVLNNNGITIPNTTTGTIINVDKILGAYPLTGTITTTSGVGTLTGVGTAFLTQLASGAYLRHGTTGVIIGIVSAITSDTSATITSGVATSGITAYAGGGTSATVTLNVTTNSTYTISAPSGIEAGQILVNGPSAFIVAGAGNSSTTVTFNSASGNIRGGGISGGANSGIKLNLTNSNVVINSLNLYGGITASDNYGVQNAGAGNTVTINATGEVSGVTGTAVVQQAATGAISITTPTIKGGTSVPGFLMALANTGTQVISATSITPSITCPAICVSNASNAGAVNTSKINVIGNITTTGNSSNPIAAIQAANYYLNSSSIKLYNTTPSEVTYSTTVGAIPDPAYVLATVPVGATVGTLTQADPAAVLAGTSYGVISSSNPATRTGTLNIGAAVWNYAASSATTPGSLGVAVKDIKTKTDNLPADTSTQLTTIQTNTTNIPNLVAQVVGNIVANLT